MNVMFQGLFLVKNTQLFYFTLLFGRIPRSVIFSPTRTSIQLEKGFTNTSRQNLRQTEERYSDIDNSHHFCTLVVKEGSVDF